MDPVGKQKKIPSSEYRVNFEKCLDGGGAKKDYGNLVTRSGSRKADAAGRVEGKFQGTVKGKNAHAHNFGD